ncbi:MAG TPA: class I SAM-dependent methyltransferase [Burkholderiales bacterium]|nr:class I SAM-dependent methyltransferase [Burkholderiales bacterium]
MRAPLLAALCLVLAPCTAPAQLETFNEAPIVDGKDVIWVPTPDAAVDRMLILARVTPNDLVVDLGSGDGKIVIAAAKRFGARSRGIEYSPDLVETSRRNARIDGVADRARFVQGDLFEADFRDATVVTLYLLTTLNLKLRPKLLDMRPGTRVVSHVFRMGDWEPDETAKTGSSEIYLWVVPAKVGGRWRVGIRDGAAFELALEQRYQRVAARIVGGDAPLRATVARLAGSELRVVIAGTGPERTLVGRVDGDRIDGADGAWRAVRLKP